MKNSSEQYQILRVARPVNHFEGIIKFYVEGLGLQILGEFKDHAGFDGIMIGDSKAPYHFEFTRKKGDDVGRSPSQDHLIVFYIPDSMSYRSRIERMKSEGFFPVKSYNPYWDQNGTTFEDCDGYRVVVYNGTWAV
jgi:hypothetical protein